MRHHAFIAAIAFAALALPAMAEPDAFRSTTANVNSPATIYREPMSRGGSVADIGRGTAVTVVEERGDWVRVHWGSHEGWIRRSDLDFPATTLTTTTTTTTQPVSNFEPAMPPSRMGTDGDWVRVHAAMGDGWVQRKDLDLDNDGMGATRTIRLVSPTSLYDQPMMTSRALSSLALDTPITYVSDQGDWVRVRTTSGEGWVQRTYVSMGDDGTVRTRTVRLVSPTSLYDQPMTTARSLSSLALDTPLTYIGDQGDWVHVRTTYGDGWVQRTYVSTGDDGTMRTRTVRLIGPTSLYEQPMTTSRSLTSLALDTPITYVSDNGDWVRVHASSGDGWVQRTYVSFDDDRTTIGSNDGR